MARFWSINGRFLTQPLSGVQRYAQEIVRGLDALIVAGHPLAKDLLAGAGSAAWPDAAAATREDCLPARGQKRRPCLGAAYAAARAARRPSSLGNAGPVAARKHIVCIHDVNTRLYPASYSAQFRALYRVLVPALGRSAARVATVSHFSAEQLAAFGIAPKRKMAVIPNGHEHALAWQPQHSMKTEKAAGPGTILVIGSPAPHKNVHMLLDLADDLAAAGLQLAIAGAADPNVFSKATPHFHAPNVFWLGPVTDNELAALLADCLGLAFPSFTEGFGLPALEAMARGCPVVSTDRASLPEVCGEGALYAAPTEPAAWLAHFRRLKDDPDLRAGLIEKGHAQARRFRWRKSAAMYLKLMARLDGLDA